MGRVGENTKAMQQYVASWGKAERGLNNIGSPLAKIGQTLREGLRKKDGTPILAEGFPKPAAGPDGNVTVQSGDQSGKGVPSAQPDGSDINNMYKEAGGLPVPRYSSLK